MLKLSKNSLDKSFTFIAEEERITKLLLKNSTVPSSTKNSSGAPEFFSTFIFLLVLFIFEGTNVFQLFKMNSQYILS